LFDFSPLFPPPCYFLNRLSVKRTAPGGRRCRFISQKEAPAEAALCAIEQTPAQSISAKEPIMATEQQTAANRRNSQNPRGPCNTTRSR
jgi:hypothetical protein